jgi:hypothetical protein
VRANNVRIEIRERGKLMGTRLVHNTWVDRGCAYLASSIALSSFGPDVAEREDRVRYFGVGIGGYQQQAVVPAAVDTAYPAGSDPFGTVGNEYREDFPFIVNSSPPPSHLPITTLERPVRITGGSNPYSTAVAGDRWLVDTPSFWVTHLTTTELTVHARIDPGAGDVVYGSFVDVPLSEAGLFTDEAAVDPTDGTAPFKPLMTYVTFDTITLSSSVVLEFIWSVRF